MKSPEGLTATDSPKKRSILRTLGRYFISGTIVILPLVVTVAIVLWLASFLLNWLGPETAFGKSLCNLGIHFNPGTYSPYILGWFLVLFALFALGFITEVILRNRLTSWMDSMIKRIPVVGMIYGTTRKFTDMFQSNGNQDLKNMSPVYCRFGEVLILALLPANREYEVDGKRYKAVIIPTAPVPFGGGLFLLPCEDVFSANISIDELLNFYVSMGVMGLESAVAPKKEA